MSQNHDDELTEALTAGALDTLAEQAHQFHTAIATGQIDFGPGGPGQVLARSPDALPAVLRRPNLTYDQVTRCGHRHSGRAHRR